MKDPAPSNITGEKSVSHIVEHTVRWDYLVLGVAVAYLAYKIGEVLATNEPDAEDGVEVPIGENSQVPAVGMEV